MVDGSAGPTDPCTAARRGPRDRPVAGPPTPTRGRRARAGEPQRASRHARTTCASQAPPAPPAARQRRAPAPHRGSPARSPAREKDLRFPPPSGTAAPRQRRAGEAQRAPGTRGRPALPQRHGSAAPAPRRGSPARSPGARTTCASPAARQQPPSTPPRPSARAAAAPATAHRRGSPVLSDPAPTVRLVLASPSRSPRPAALPRVPVQSTLDDLGTPLRATTFVVVDLETTGGSPAQLRRSPRSARSRSAAARCSASSRRWSTRSRAIPAFIAVLTGITDAMVAGAPAPGHRAAGLPGVRPRRGAGRAQRALRPRASSRPGARSSAWTGRRRASVDTARLARRVLTRDEAPNCKLSTLARLFRADVDALPPGAGRRPGHRRRAARAARAARRARRAQPGGADDLLRPGQRGRSGASGTSPTRCRQRARASTSSATPRAGRSTSARARTCAAGCAPTSPPPRPAPAWPRWWPAPSGSTRSCARPPLEAEVRELRLIAEHRPRYNRRSQVPRAGVVGQAHRRGLPAAVAGAPGARRRRRLPRPVRQQPHRRAGGGRGARGAPAAPVHPAAQRRARPAAPACCSRWAAAARRASGREPVEDYAAARRRRSAPAVADDPAAVVEALRPAHRARSPPTSASRTPPPSATGSPPSSGPRPGCSGCSALTRVAAAGRGPAHRRPRLGARRRAPRPPGRRRACCPRGRAPGPFVDALVATAETVLPGPGPLPAATAEEVECVLRWLEQPGTRLVRLEGTWASPAPGRRRAPPVAAGGRGRPAAAARPFADRRGLRPEARPAAGRRAVTPFRARTAGERASERGSAPQRRAQRPQRATRGSRCSKCPPGTVTSVLSSPAARAAST